MTTELATSRRDFLGTTTLAASAALLASGGVFAGSNDVLRVGLVGCGGRGTGAAKDALLADPNVKLVAMADAFDDRLQESLKTLQRIKKIAPKIDVKPEMCFTGFDGYKKVIDNVDVVLLCTPPGFRPLHVRAALEAKKHVFCEKPVAVDAPGVRSIIESAALAKKIGRSLMTGFCYRYDLAKRETLKRIHDGAIGDIVTIQANYLTGTLWHRGTNPAWSEMEQQMRNWYYYTWLSGDHIVEQHCHNLDKAAWTLKGAMPVAAYGIGGRQQRVEAMWGNIFDHHLVTFEYADGARVISLCRQQAGCFNDVSDHIIGTKGNADLMSHVIRAGETKWKYTGEEPPSMYEQEHREFFAGIRSGELINDGFAGAQSTLMAIMGRMATYTGQKITWEQALNSKEDLSPPEYKWGPLKVAPIAVPGVTKFS